MRAIYALYRDGNAAQRAVDALRAAGLADGQITVITGEPMEDYEFSRIGRKNRLWYAACGGGLCGFLGSAWLTQFAEQAWPMNVGNMSTVAWWPNSIVVFEMTMLGAILATVVALVAANGLFRRRHVLYDPEVTNGKILVGVENPGQGSLEDVERALRVAPDVALKTI